MTVTVWKVASVEVNGRVVFPTLTKPVKVTDAMMVKVPVLFPVTVNVVPVLSNTEESKDHEVR